MKLLWVAPSDMADMPAARRPAIFAEVDYGCDCDRALDEVRLYALRRQPPSMLKNKKTVKEVLLDDTSPVPIRSAVRNNVSP